MARPSSAGRRAARASAREAAAAAPGPHPQPAADPLQEFGALFENANDIVLFNDREGQVVAANRAAREFGGYTLEEVRRGVSLREVLAADEFSAAMLLTARALDGLPVPEVYEREVVRRDGSRGVLELRSNRWQHGSAPPLLQTIGRDITERKQADAFQNGLLQVAQALLTAQSLDDLGRVVCEEAGRVLDVNGAYLWLRRDGELVGSAAAGRGAQAFVGQRCSLDDPFIGLIYRATDVLLINDFQHSLYNHDAPWEWGVQSLLAVPLRRGDPAVGVLVFTDDGQHRRFTAALRERALIFGAQTTVAIESALARAREDEEGRVSAALLGVTRAIRESLGESEVLREIARGAREASQCDWAFIALRTPNGTLRVVEAAGWPAGFAGELQIVEFDPAKFPELLPLLAFHTVEVREPPRGELYARWQVSSFLAAPMVRAGGLVGSISVGYWQRRGPFPARARRVAEGLAVQAAVAVENARLMEDLRAANRLKSEFLGTMSHELRTPLNAILGYTDLLCEGAMGPFNAEQLEALGRIQLNGRSLLELINMTLDVNRLEAGRVGVSPSEFTLADLLGELRGEFSVGVRPGVALTWPDAAALPPLRSDHAKLKVILRNLVDNALKYTPHGRVEISAEADGDLDRVRVAVRDTGVGIEPSAIPTIFEMFRQLGERTGSRAGVGLGLYVVHRYVELLGGRITVASSPGQGSTFTIDIPSRMAAPG